MASAAMPQFIGPWDTQIVATAIHAGHDLRPDVAAAMLLRATCARICRPAAAPPRWSSPTRCSK